MTHLVLVPLTLVVLAGQEIRDLPITVDAPTARAAAGEPRADLEIRFERRVPDAIPDGIDVVRLVRSPGPAGWQVGDVTRAGGRDGVAIVNGPVGAGTLLLIRAPGHEGYLLDGPFRWPAHRSMRVVSTAWRRTVRGTATAGGGPLTWIGGSDAPPQDAWPQCAWHGAGTWECVGVPMGVPGVVVTVDGARQLHALASGTTAGIEMTQALEAAWGTVVVVGRTDRVPLTAADAVTARSRRIVVPRNRPRSLRLEAGADDRIAVRRLAETVFWIGGQDLPGGTWVEIAAANRAPVRLEVTDMAAAPSGQPIRIDLEPAVSIGGRVATGEGGVAPGTVLTLWRVLDPPAATSDTDPPPRRVFVAETTSDAEGSFGFGGLAGDAHEIVALHAMLGRAEVRLADGDREVDVRLTRPSVAIGQVVRDGQPLAGVRVSVAPDLLEVAASEDLSLSMGGQARSDQQGRFRVALPTRGRSEVRVGELGGIRRFPLGPGESLPPVVDLGTFTLEGAGVTVRLVLEGAEGCDVMMSGPVGRSGLSLVRSQRIGPAMFEAAVPEPGAWLVSATCGRQNRVVQPAMIDVTAPGPLTIPLVWR